MVNDFIRYLAAKKSVDDRALNAHVWRTLQSQLANGDETTPLRVLEIGAGIGTMLERWWSWGKARSIDYTAVDAEPQHIDVAHTRLRAWATANALDFHSAGRALRISNAERVLLARLEAMDAFDFAARRQTTASWDLLIAHAFLDLVDIPSALSKLFPLLRQDGLFYFTINFDGVTRFQPVLDPAFDALIESLYHRTMDERIVAGRPSGDSHCGSHLFTHLAAAGAEVIAAGASDWVVHPLAGRYPHDEAYFLHFIVNTIHGALAGHPELDVQRFERWIDERHRQIDRGQLVYIAHQLDFVGRTR